LDEEFWKFLEVRRAIEEEVKYKMFLYNQMHLAEPEQREVWMKQFPWIWKDFEEANVEIKKVMNKMIDLQLYGIKSEKDYRFIYALNTGVFDFPVEQSDKFIPPTVRHEAIEQVEQKAVLQVKSDADLEDLPISEGTDVLATSSNQPASWAGAASGGPLQLPAPPPAGNA